MTTELIMQFLLTRINSVPDDDDGASDLPESTDSCDCQAENFTG